MTKFALLPLLCGMLAAADAPAPVAAKVDPAQTAKPAPEAKPKSETLRFNVNWPSGLSLGEGEMTSSFDGKHWNFSYKVDAAVPGFAILEGANSKADANYCSVELNKRSTRGSRSTEERTEFDHADLSATRTTVLPKGGGKSEMKTSSCPRDALAFIHFLRRELAAGRLPAAQPVYYGAGYQAHVQYKGTQKIRSGDAMVEADRLQASIKGPSTQLTVDLFFARDEPRTPLLAETPLPMGKFTVEFVR